MKRKPSGKPTADSTTSLSHKRARALKLATEGHTMESIATEMGVTSEQVNVYLSDRRHARSKDGAIAKDSPVYDYFRAVFNDWD